MAKAKHSPRVRSAAGANFGWKAKIQYRTILGFNRPGDHVSQGLELPCGCPAAWSLIQFHRGCLKKIIQCRMDLRITYPMVRQRTARRSGVNRLPHYTVSCLGRPPKALQAPMWRICSMPKLPNQGHAIGPLRAIWRLVRVLARAIVY